MILVQGHARCQGRKMRYFKLLLIGDSGTGKAEITSALSSELLVFRQRPTDLILSSASTIGDREEYYIKFFDPYGLPGRRGRSSFKVTLIVTAVDKPDSAIVLKSKWSAFISHPPVILVVNRVHLRNDSYTIRVLEEQKMEPLRQQDCLNLAGSIGAEGYIEVSTVTGYGLEELLSTIFKAAIQVKRSSSCSIS